MSTAVHPHPDPFTAREAHLVERGAAPALEVGGGCEGHMDPDELPVIAAGTAANRTTWSVGEWKSRKEPINR